MTGPNPEGQPSEPTTGAEEAPLPWPPSGSTEGLSPDGQPNAAAETGTGWAPGGGAFDQPAGKPRRSRRKITIVSGVAAAAAYLGVKLVAGLVAVSIASQALTGVFGGPFEKLPADYRQVVEKRIEAAVPNVKSMSESDAKAHLEALETDGFLRLDDATLTRFWGLFSTAMGGADNTTCATFARESLAKASGTSNDQKLAANLDEPSLEAFADIAVQAIEAGGRGSPARRTISEAEAAPVLEEAFAAMTPDQVATLTAMTDGTKVSDDAACGVWRAMMAGIDRVDATRKGTLIPYLLS